MKNFYKIGEICGGFSESSSENQAQEPQLVRGTSKNPIEILPGIQDLGSGWFGDDLVRIKGKNFCIANKNQTIYDCCGAWAIGIGQGFLCSSLVGGVIVALFAR